MRFEVCERAPQGWRGLLLAACAASMAIGPCAQATDSQCGAGAGDCFSANGSPGCEDLQCCRLVCEVDPFCCIADWDTPCAEIALDLCTACGERSAGSCFVNNGLPSCDNVACCTAVCLVDPFCCESSWDNKCVQEAIDLCTECGDPGAGDCWEANGTPACNDADCCNAICSVDPFCCNTEWDQVCADAYPATCEPCGPGSGFCYLVNDTPGCFDTDCCALVCSIRPECCSGPWDEACAELGLTMCVGCGEPEAGSCFTAHPTPGCDNLECCAVGCEINPLCCLTEWTEVCAQNSLLLCASCGGKGAGSCYEANGTPSCNDGECCMAVCAIDPFCCESTWDISCTGIAQEVCAKCGGAGAGDCDVENGTPFCNDESCCQLICVSDPFCCEVEWDIDCAIMAHFVCEPACPQDCVSSGTFMPPPDGQVDGADLAVLLGDWGRCAGCCADAVTSDTFQPPPDGVVDGADLAVLLGAWGDPGCED